MSNELDVNKITAEVIGELAKCAAKKVLGGISKKYKDLVHKDQVDYGTAFEKYLKEAQTYIGKAKTILYGQTPHDLYTFFECVGIRNKNEIIDTSDVYNILEIGHKIIISGTGGIGKSMLMRHCFLNAIKTTYFVPVLIELRGLNEYQKEDISIEQYIFRTLAKFGFTLEEEYFKYSLESGCYLILLDGYDEVKNAISQKVTQEIMDFSQKYSENYFIVSSRPLEEFVGWSDFTEYTSMPLNKEQALSLIAKLDYDEEIKGKFYEKLKEELYEKYYSFASNPLLLTIMLMTFEGRISIPDNRIDFYEQAFSTLFHKHDAMKRGKYKRDILSGLGYEDFKKIFSYFCFRSFFMNQYEFTTKTALENIIRAREKVLPHVKFEAVDFLDDMTKSVCMLVHEGLNYRFSHRSFQEYFAAVYATQLSDADQKQFIISWIRDTSERLTTDFINILCELQPDRFMRNILYDALCELVDMYETNGYSDEWFVNYMYEGIVIHTMDDERRRIFVRVKDSYYHTFFKYALIYFRYSFNDVEIGEGYDELVEKLQEKYLKGDAFGVSFEQLKEDGLYEEVMEVMGWVVQRKEYVFKAFQEVDINMFGRKRKFESMLEAL